MKDFFDNISRYPRYFISFILGIFFFFFGNLRPFLKNPVSAIALLGIFVAFAAFIVLTLRAMFGLTPL
ncbi:MAG: DUF751 family protein [Chloroflexaceae bacterium]|nr:DUF751 family protein [Chloroflexaceae bacterium]